MTANVKVVIEGDAKSVKSAFGEASGAVGKFQGVVQTAGGVMTGVLGAQIVSKGLEAAVGFMSDGIGNASDLAEQTSKLGQVFGTSANRIEEWSHTTATALGLTEREAKTAASNFGVLLESQGKGEGASADWSKKLTTLAGDMASFNNADISDTIAAISSGLRGESEPLRKYGVNLSDAALKAEALAQHIDDGKGPLTDQQKQTAALGLIFKQTAKQQGDFARTSDGLANTQRTNAAVLEEVGTKIGTLLLPAVTELARFVGDSVLPVLSALADSLGPTLSPILAALGPMFQQLGAVILPIFQAALAVLAPVLATVGKFLGEVVLPAILELAGALQSALAPLVAKLAPLFAAWAPYIATVADLATKVGGVIIGALVPALKIVIDVLGILIGIFIDILTVVGKVASIFAKFAGPIITDLLKGLSGLIKVGTTIVENIIKGIKDMAGEVVKAILGLLPGPLKDAIGGIIGVHGTSAAAMSSRAVQATSPAPQAASSGTTTINIYTTGDSLSTQRAVARAMRRQGRLNAGVIPAWATSS